MLLKECSLLKDKKILRTKKLSPNGVFMGRGSGGGQLNAVRIM